MNRAASLGQVGFRLACRQKRLIVLFQRRSLKDGWMVRKCQQNIQKPVPKWWCYSKKFLQSFCSRRQTSKKDDFASLSRRGWPTWQYANGRITIQSISIQGLSWYRGANGRGPEMQPFLLLRASWHLNHVWMAELVLQGFGQSEDFDVANHPARDRSMVSWLLAGIMFNAEAILRWNQSGSHFEWYAAEMEIRDKSFPAARRTAME